MFNKLFKKVNLFNTVDFSQDEMWVLNHPEDDYSYALALRYFYNETISCDYIKFKREAESFCSYKSTRSKHFTLEYLNRAYKKGYMFKIEDAHSRDFIGDSWIRLQHAAYYGVEPNEEELEKYRDEKKKQSERLAAIYKRIEDKKLKDQRDAMIKRRERKIAAKIDKAKEFAF